MKMNTANTSINWTSWKDEQYNDQDQELLVA